PSHRGVPGTTGMALTPHQNWSSTWPRRFFELKISLLLCLASLTFLNNRAKVWSWLSSLRQSKISEPTVHHYLKNVAQFLQYININTCDLAAHMPALPHGFGLIDWWTIIPLTYYTHAIGCLQSRDSEEARNADGGQEVIFLYRNQYQNLKMTMFSVVYGNRSNREISFRIVYENLLFLRRKRQGLTEKKQGKVACKPVSADRRTVR
ncbi:hypothetical protein M9458_053065, partial [Cirrhinus mrigala]